ASVEAMVSALPTEASDVIRLKSRVPRIAGIVAGSVLALGGLAAAGGGTFLPSQSSAPFEHAPPASRPPVSVPASDNRTAPPSTESTTTSSTTTTTSLAASSAEPITVEEAAAADVTDSAPLVDDP